MWSRTGERPRSGKAGNSDWSETSKDFPLLGQRLIKGAAGKAKEPRESMLTELDRRFDEGLAEVTGPGGRLVIAKDEQGRAIVANFPDTLPSLFRTFSSLNAEAEAVVCGAERL